MAALSGIVVGAALLATASGLAIWNETARWSEWSQEDELLHSQYHLPEADEGRLPDQEILGRQEDNNALDRGIDTLRVVNAVLFGVGGAAVAAGVLLLALGPDPERYRGVSLAPAPGGFSLAMGW